MRIFILTILLLLSYMSQAGNRKPVVTFVTGLWDVGRGHFRSGYKRTYQFYLGFYKQLLQTNTNIIAFGDSSLKQFTAEHRHRPNTLFIQKQLSQIQNYWYTPKIWQVNEYLKSHPDQFDWDHFEELPQYGLKMYNPAVMSKLNLVREALEKDIFHTDYFVWVDGGITHAFDKEAFLKQAFQKIIEYYQIDWFIKISPSYGWRTFDLGFKKGSIQYITQDPLEITQAGCWANWMGGKVQAVTTVLAVYENILRVTLQNKEMNTDETVFAIMVQRYPYLLTRLTIVNAEQYIKFQANQMDYNGEIQVQREYRFIVNQSKPLLTQAPATSPFFFLKKSAYDSSTSSILFSIYSTTLVYRLAMILVTIGAYILVKFGYLNSHLKSFQYQIIQSRPNQNQ